MQVELTKRQQEIIDYLRMSQRNTGIMPTTREMQRYFRFASQTAAMSHLRALERKGVIQRLPGKARAVIFPDELNRGEIADIPIYGNIAAGKAASRWTSPRSASPAARAPSPSRSAGTR
jgi:repressor LexA